MRTSSRLALAIALAPSVASAQLGQWRQSWPPVEPALVDVVSTSALEAWVAAEDGELRHTTNGGVFWSSQQLAVSELAAVAVRGSWVCAVGDGIQRSIDSGQLWNTAASTPGLRDVYLATSTAGWAVGDSGRVLRTVDGGANWIQSNLPGVTSTLRGVHFLNSTTGWLVGDNGKHFKSTDGGASWTAVAVPNSSHFTDVFYVDAQRGWIAAGDSVLITQNGGVGWVAMPIGGGARADRLSVLGGNWLWCAGTAGVIAASANAGVSWSQQFATGGTPLFDVSMGDLFSGFAVGANGAVYRTTDGGTQWQLIAGGSGPSTDLVYDVERVGANVWASVSNSTILRSTDNGANWTPTPAGLSNVSYAALDFFDAQHGYAVGRRLGSTPTTAWTADGGLTWNPTYWIGMYTLADVDALSAGVAIACADNGLLRTTNGGINWSFINSTPLSGFFGADFVDAQRGWAVGYDIVKTVDGGLNWTLLSSPSATLRAVSFADELRGWAVGDNGLILATVDGGSNWNVQDASAPSLWTVEALSPSVVWITGTSGFVARSTDGGANWIATPPAGLGNSDSFGSSFAASDDGFITSFYPVSAIWQRTGPTCSASAYCQAKISSSGCIPSLQSSGAPSLGNPGNCFINTVNVERDKAGVMFVGLNGRSALPFQGGVLCVAPPLYRLAASNSGGAGTCQGAFSYTLADLVNHPSVGPALAPTVLVNCQTWFRDPSASNTSGLSDGLELSLCP